MLVKTAGWLYRKLGPRYFLSYLAWELFSALFIALGTVGIFSLYQRLSDDQLWTIVLFSWGTVLLALAAGFKKVRRSSRPLRAWIEGGRGKDGAAEAWRTAVALPLINVVTGVVVSGLSANDRGQISQLGLDVAVAVLVAFTISLELTLLVTRSVLSPVHDLMEVTEHVRAGDLSARAPVVSGDEMGVLTRGFNAMLDGLQERERLREAFGSYVAPDVAERVLREGTLLEGDEVEVSIVFVDICNFTAFAERASARETVAYLNDFFGLVVPILDRHGGHANKFIGDGVLGVFGAPERQRDHADRALAAACEIALTAEDRYGERRSIGGGGRLEFAVVGDAVNVAARVERATRELGDRVLLTEATRCLLTRDGIPIEERGTVPLKGKSEPVPIWAPDLDALRG